MIDYHFRNFTDQIEGFANEEFVTVFRDISTDLKDGKSREAIHGMLVPNSEAKKESKKAQWVCNLTSLSPRVVRYADGPDQYKRWGIDGRIEPIVYQQFFNNIFPTQYRVIEEFILYFNLFEDKKAGYYKSMNIYSDSSVVIKFSEDEISIRKHELKIFLALKKMTLFVQFEYFFFSKQDLAFHGVKQNDECVVISDQYQWIINYQNTSFGLDDHKSNARLLGKKAIHGYSNYKEPNIYEMAMGKREYMAFIVDTNPDGTPKMMSSNIDQLSAADKKEFAYRLVFFKPEVLEKYYKNPALFSVEDGCIIKKGSWTLEIDNDNPGYVGSYLIDIGKLNYEEQSYWRSYNVIPVGNISDVKFKRDFLSDPFVEPSAVDLLFKKYFPQLSKQFLLKYGFDLFLPLKAGDFHYFKNIRRPINEDDHEFDQIIICLSKVLNDSINVGELKKREAAELYPIDRLQQFLIAEFGDDFNIPSLLKSIQAIRSAGVAHRKGSDYAKLFKKLSIDSKSHFQIINDYLLGLSTGFKKICATL